MKKVLTIAFLFTLLATANAQITSDFNTSDDGWTFIYPFIPLTPTHSTTGGNTGGYVSNTYTASVYNYYITATQVWKAPGKFLGNQVVRSMDMNLRFDLQQSQNGTSSDVNGDIIIRSVSSSITYSLPIKPAVAPAWSSYSLTLDETQGWRMNNVNGALATRTQIIAILTNITSIEIRGSYAANATYTSGLDNVVLEQKTLAIAPFTTSLSTTSGKMGDVITINGSGFNTTAASNVVVFGLGGIKAVVQSASATQLTVVVPQNAPYGPIVITNTATGLSARTAPFNPVFDGGGRIIPASFKPKLDIPTITIEAISAADVDGDGWMDLAVTNDFTDRVIDIYRNLGAGGTLSAASFAAKVSIAYTGVSCNGSGVWFVDLDGDGKPDAITSNSAGGIGLYVTFRNTSTPGSISFEAPEYWNGASDESPISFIADLDGDGRPEMMSGEGAIPGGFWFNQNMSTPGNIEFSSWVAPFGLSVINGFTQANASDLNGDGKPELIVTNGQGQAIDVLQNVSTPGAPAFTQAFQFSTNQYTNTPLSVADMNLDGKNDLLYKTSGEVGFHIRLNADTDGTLTAADFAADLIITGDLSGLGGISISDMNGDGKPDIVASDNTDFGVFENVFAGGVFDVNSLVPAYQYEAPGLNTYPTAPIAVDLNGDGKPEIFAGITNSGNPDKFTIYENVNSVAPLISLNTVSPLAGPVGSTVTITGSNFSTVTTENMVSFGSVKATVLTAAANQLTVTVPPGAGYAPVSVTKAELTSTYHLPFQTTFSSGVTFDNTHFAPPVQFTLTNADYDIVVSDLDSDGLPDVVAEGTALSGLTSLFRNTHTSGPISATSLTLNGTITSAHSPRLKDLDGDGLIDMVGARGTVHKNNSTAGNIAFLAGVSLANVDGFLAAFADFNQDGKTEIVVTGAALSVIMVENRTTNLTGNFTTGTFSSFAPGVVVPRPGNNGTLITGDFDNDGYKDMIATNPFLDNISIYRNAKRPRANATSFATSVELTVGDNPQFIYTGDFDRDGKLDVLVQHGAGTTSALLIVFQNTSTVGNMSFNRIDLTNPSASTVAIIADLDGDGKPEIMTTSESGNRFSIFKNLHTTGALTAASFATPFNTTVTAPRGITTGDLNVDGKPDIIITRAAGLLLVYETLIPSDPTITSFTPSSGPVGNSVTITGTNFSTTPANNTVAFNGTTASVTASTATSITTSVPSGATTGKITVTVGGNTATSATDFTVTTLALPTITSFTPSSGPIGNSVLITGTNFNTTPANNTVAFNGTTTTVIASTATSITTSVPPGATTGKITVTVGGNTAISATDFTVTTIAPPTITSFTPSSGPIGNTVIITGTNFSTTPANNTVAFNGTTASVTASTTTSITTSVPIGATTGKITVTVGGNAATSTNDFTITTSGGMVTIDTETLGTTIGGTITKDLVPLITTLNANLDISSIVILTPPPSGALASLSNGVLTVDYTNIAFSGRESIAIRACDTDGNCTAQLFEIEIAGDIVVYNALSPEGKNPVFRLEYIDLFPDTKKNTVYIYNRWGDEVFASSDYDNVTRVFRGLSSSGDKLPSGTYFYKVLFASGRKTMTGYLELRY